MNIETKLRQIEVKIDNLTSFASTIAAKLDTIHAVLTSSSPQRRPDGRIIRQGPGSPGRN